MGAQEHASLMEDEARFLYFNSSSTATSLTILGAVILLGVIFYLVYVGGLLSPASSGYAYNRMTTSTISSMTTMPGPPLTAGTLTASTSSGGSPCSRRSTRSSTTTTSSARRG